MKIYLAHGRGGSQHSKEIFHLARTAKRVGHETHCINNIDTDDPELRSVRLTVTGRHPATAALCPHHARRENA